LHVCFFKKIYKKTFFCHLKQPLELHPLTLSRDQSQCPSLRRVSVTSPPQARPAPVTGTKPGHLLKEKYRYELTEITPLLAVTDRPGLAARPYYPHVVTPINPRHYLATVMWLVLLFITNLFPQGR
jgi:hypothetical protein